MAAMRWGFPKFDGKGEIINARSETAAEKNTFRRPMMEGRCLVPASWYYEWEKQGSKKIKYSLAAPDNSPVWMAGLSKIDSKTGESLFVILTRPAWSGISFIHGDSGRTCYRINKSGKINDLLRTVCQGKH